MNEPILLHELVAAMTRRGTPIAVESALFIALQAAECMRATRARVAVETLALTPEGEVQIQGAPAALHEKESLASLARVVGTIVPPGVIAVRDLLARVRSGSVATMSAFRNELEAQLVPLNRGAARRVLGRLAREAQHIRSSGIAPAATPAPAPARSTSSLDTMIDAPPAFDEPSPAQLAPRELAQLARTSTDAHDSAIDTEPDGATRPELDGASALDTADDNAPAPTPLTRRRKSRARDEAADSVDTLDESPLDRDEGTDDDLPPVRGLRTRRGSRPRSSGSGRLLAVAAAVLVAASVSFVLYRLAAPRATAGLPRPAATRTASR